MNSTDPFFTIVTVVRNDVWALSKTLRSVSMQSFRDFQYVVVDGESDDGIGDLVEFWQSQRLIDRYVSEEDRSVYEAMNKAVHLARGRFVCFMNAGDVFNSIHELQVAFGVLSESPDLDGVLGWGSLKSQIWASWHLETDAIRLASLGFCHQSLYLNRDWLIRHPFDDREEKTDSDTKQIADCIADGANIRIIPRVMAIRDTSEGLSANLEVSRKSVSETILSNYADVSPEHANDIITFRRTCGEVGKIISLLKHSNKRLRHDLAIMVLDTVFLKQAKSLSTEESHLLISAATETLAKSGHTMGPLLRALRDTQIRKLRKLEDAAQKVRQIQRLCDEAQQKHWDTHSSIVVESNRTNYFISFTTFPNRVKSLHLVLQSLVKQTLRPEGIQLIVGRDEFRNEWALPEEVRKFQAVGLKLVFAEKTCHQYDKFIHTIDQNKTLPLIIVDDDVIYVPDALEKLVTTAQEHPDSVIANRCHRISLNEAGGINAYSEWEREVFEELPSHGLFATGAGGVLYPPGFLSNCPIGNTILKLCPYADDVWFKMMSLRTGKKVKATRQPGQGTWKLGYTPDMSEFALHQGNVEFGLNDVQMNKAFEWLTDQGVDWKSLVTEAGVQPG